MVLDSNVWIDILVFDDPAARPIRDALETGAITALIDVRCLVELERVLDYPQFKARSVDKAAALATVARLSERVAGPDRGEPRESAATTGAGVDRSLAIASSAGASNSPNPLNASDLPDATDAADAQADRTDSPSPADAAAPSPAADAPPPRPLPKCKDRDDQKFLELAYAARADWLVSKDRALLKLARRTERDFGFRIAQPAPFAASALAADASEPA
ncbi:PIN domain-containing protein [Burkholderia oklahomensis]|uniref:Toxin-antitoxin system toxin component, PIN family n=1 Tax=Burkholderia oklahomensis TaxID=342113 RepID=A0AAI8B7G9_9BURK|nr:PIN domain-containing protein [Burkholderia oklahomensis]AIO66909.1 toxin-antitoxin system toxin component, PIN family [Burkholderia oklahomensis]